MAVKIQGGLSKRAWSNVEGIMPKISAAVAERVKVDNPKIDLSTAENWLLRDEINTIYREAIVEKLSAQDLSYPRAFAGFPEVLAAFASFFNSHFNPHTPIEISQLATAPGAASCIDTLLYNICDPGEGVLVPAPYWSGYDFQFKARSSAIPIPVITSSFRTTISEDLLSALEDAYSNATVTVRGLLLTNPSNPLAQCYSKAVIEGCIRFCEKHEIHFITSEVYALTSFKSPDFTEQQPFVSALSIDARSIGCDPSRIHVVWSTSKDFGSSGIRMGCSVTQANKEMAVGLALASNTQTSTLSSIATAALLTSPKAIQLLARNSELLTENYQLLTDFLKKHNIPYIPAYAGLYLLAHLAPDAQSWEDEAAIIGKLKDAGVLVSGARGYHGPEIEKGWARVGFAVSKEKMIEALCRIETVYQSQDQTAPGSSAAQQAAHPATEGTDRSVTGSGILYAAEEAILPATEQSLSSAAEKTELTATEQVCPPVKEEYGISASKQVGSQATQHADHPILEQRDGSFTGSIDHPTAKQVHFPPMGQPDLPATEQVDMPVVR